VTVRALSVAAVLCLAASPLLSGEPIVGVARVIDGDTIQIGQSRIRLAGIDAPEMAQEQGSASAWHLRAIVAQNRVSCAPQGHDRFSRTIATCSIDGGDIGREMVLAGQAIAYRRYSTAYVADELVAKSAKRGIWSGAFVEPEEFRRAR